MRQGTGVDTILDLHAIDLPDDSVGTVLCFDTLEHVEEPRRAVEELFRILRPGGLLAITSVMDFHIHDHPHDYWRFTPDAFRSLLRPFTQIWVESAGREIFPPHRRRRRRQGREHPTGTVSRRGSRTGSAGGGTPKGASWENRGPAGDAAVPARPLPAAQAGVSVRSHFIPVSRASSAATSVFGAIIAVGVGDQVGDSRPSRPARPGGRRASRGDRHRAARRSARGPRRPASPARRPARRTRTQAVVMVMVGIHHKVFLPRTNQVGSPWLMRSVASGRARQSCRRAGSGSVSCGLGDTAGNAGCIGRG